MGWAGGQGDQLSRSLAVRVHCSWKKRKKKKIYIHIKSVAGVSSQCGGTAELVWWGI